MLGIWSKIIFCDLWNQIPTSVLKKIQFRYGSGSGSCYFRQWPSRRQQKFFCSLLFEGTFTSSFFKDNKSWRSHKTVGIKGFLLFLLDDKRIRIRIRIRPLTNGSGSGSRRPKNIRIRTRNTGKICIRTMMSRPEDVGILGGLGDGVTAVAADPDSDPQHCFTLYKDSW